MVHRKGELDKAMTDGNWPHQVAVPAYRCMEHNYRTIFYCQELSLSPRTHAFRRDTADMTVFCFAQSEHAKQFRDRFGGEIIDPAMRPRRRDTRARRDHLSAEQRLRNGRCIIATTEFHLAHVRPHGQTCTRAR